MKDKQKTPTNKLELLYRLLRVNIQSFTEKELKDYFDYFVSLEEKYLEHNKLRARILKVIPKQLESCPKDLLESVRDLIVDLTVREARSDFYTFVKLTAEVVIPNKYKDGRHIEVICDALQELYDSYERYQEQPRLYRTDRLQVFLPPRSMKSVLCSILFPAWILGKNPKYRILLIGNSVQTATDVFGRPLKNFISSAEYQEIFPETKLDPQASSAQRFFTMAGGGYFCAGAGTSIAGRGGDFIICDDVLSEQSAFSKVERTKINLNYIPGIRSRSQPGAAELLINTRWHLDDLSGFLMNTDGIHGSGEDPVKAGRGHYRPWKIISVPAVLDEDGAAALRKASDPPEKFTPGTSYWPEYKTLEELMALREAYLQTEPWKWYALYLQNPVPDSGGIVKRGDFQIWPKTLKLPQVSQVVVVLDTAFSEKERADPSGYQVWGVFHREYEGINGKTLIPNAILLYAKKGKWSFPDLCKEVEKVKNDPRWAPVDFFIIEKKSSGIGLLQELHRQGYPLIEYDPRAKKEERLQAAAVLMQAERVWVPEGVLWGEEVIEEVCNFPSAAHDEHPDCLSMMLIWMRDNGVIRHEGYDRDDEDEIPEDVTPKSYWSSLFGMR